MSTDDDLTTLLRHGFTHATADLDPDPDLARVVRRRYVRARRRRLAAAVVVPAAALAVGSGLALAGRDIPNHAAVAVPKTAPVTPVPVKPASYKVVALKSHSAPPGCPANATAPFGKSANPGGVWFWTNGKCFFVGVGGSDTKPGDAAPLHVKGYPGLFVTLKDGVRTIYAPGIGHRGWWVLTMAANVPQDTAVRMIVVTAN